MVCSFQATKCPAWVKFTPPRSKTNISITTFRKGTNRPTAVKTSRTWVLLGGKGAWKYLLAENFLVHGCIGRCCVITWFFFSLLFFLLWSCPSGTRHSFRTTRNGCSFDSKRAGRYIDMAYPFTRNARTTSHHFCPMLLHPFFRPLFMWLRCTRWDWIWSGIIQTFRHLYLSFCSVVEVNNLRWYQRLTYIKPARMPVRRSQNCGD